MDRGRRWKAGGLAAICVAMTATFGFGGPPDVNSPMDKEWPGETIHLFDLGVADINDDGRMDVFTVNHSALQRIYLQDAHGRLVDRFVSLGLDQNPAIPGIEPSGQGPDIREHGLYVYWLGGRLLVQANAIAHPLKAHLRLPATTAIAGNSGFDVLDTKTASMREIRIALPAGGNGRLEIASTMYFYNPQLSIDPGFPLQDILLGRNRIRPAAHAFEMETGVDRHGVAWVDLNGDGRKDALFSSGGLGGLLPIAGNARDELFYQDEEGRFARAQDRVFYKRGCPTRQLSAVDVDRDGLVDIYIGCGRGEEPRKHFPNTYLHQTEDAGFESLARGVGLDIPERGPYLWLDVNKDLELELLVARDDGVWLYQRVPSDGRGDAAKATYIGQRIGAAARVNNFSVGDFDADGDLDVFVASYQHNKLLINEQGRLRMMDARKLGFPQASRHANWVDFDNDGWPDLHLLPQGLFKQGRKGRFWLLDEKALKTSRAVAASWVDLDNNGRRDLLAAVLRKLPKDGDTTRSDDGKQDALTDGGRHRYFTPKRLGIFAARFAANDNHWLEMVVEGPAGDREAVGTLVEVTGEDGHRQLFQVGQSEGSSHSQGHYRLYAGLGKARHATVRILWRDGTVSEWRDIAVDQLFHARNGDGAVTDLGAAAN